MAIENGTYIKLNYTGAVAGKAFDTTDAEVAKKQGIFREQAVYGPSVVKVGAGHVMPGLDADLAGKEIGKEYKITLAPEKAFGEHKREELKAIDKKAFKNKPEILEEVTIEGRKGIVVNKIGNRYIVDFNHPLAGQTVEYTYTIEGVVEDGCEILAGVVKLFTGREMEVSATNTEVSVEVPAMIALYNQNWFMVQHMITQEAFEIFPDIKSVKFFETFPRPEKKEAEESAAPVEEQKTE